MKLPSCKARSPNVFTREAEPSLNVPSHKTSLDPSLAGRHIRSECALPLVGALKAPTGRHLNGKLGVYATAS